MRVNKKHHLEEQVREQKFSENMWGKFQKAVHLDNFKIRDENCTMETKANPLQSEGES